MKYLNKIEQEKRFRKMISDELKKIAGNKKIFVEITKKDLELINKS